MSEKRKIAGFFTKLRKGVYGVSLSAIVASILTVSSTLALLWSATDIVRNEFLPGRVDCEVEESFDGTAKSSIKIQNTGNTDAYIRVNFVSYYQNTSGAIIGQTASVPEFELGDGWTYGADGYYYYKYPIAPDVLTGEMLASPIVLSQKTDSEGNVISNQVVEVFAEAVQAYPEDAVVYAWDSVAAVTGEDDHLAIKVRVYGNYGSAVAGAQYRLHLVDGTTVCTTSAEGTALNYHTGMLNDGQPDSDKMLTITPNGTSNRIGMSVYLMNYVEVDRLALYFASFDNIQSVDVYAGTTEMVLADGTAYGDKIGTLTKSSVTGDYTTDIEEYQQIEYSLKTQGKTVATFIGFVITLKDATTPINLSEIRVLGYMDTRDISPAATYKGETGTITLPQNEATDTGADFTSWTEYHAGRLNDKRRSSTYNDDREEEKVIIQCSDDSADTMRIIYKLASGEVVNSADVYAGALATVTNGTDDQSVANNPISAINVYLSETENQEDWKLLGTTTEGNLDNSRFLKLYKISGEPLYGRYVIVELKGTPGRMTFGVNEVQIWSNAILATDE